MCRSRFRASRNLIFRSNNLTSLDREDVGNMTGDDRRFQIVVLTSASSRPLPEISIMNYQGRGRAVSESNDDGDNTETTRFCYDPHRQS